MAEGLQHAGEFKIDMCELITSSGMRIDLEWDATTNVKALILGGGVALEPTVGHLDFRSFGGIKNNSAGGITGDIDLTTLHHTNNDAYTIILELKKSY